MKSYEVKIAPYALDQIAEIRDYIMNQLLNPDAARNLVEEIKSEVLNLGQIPERFRTIDEEPWGEQGVRKIMVRNYYVYYWIEEDAAVVHVIAVAYAKRNQKNVLKKMGYFRCTSAADM